ncbi:MAG: BMP family ABC transporter substrate-binding protein, partial [Burkholderiales bacterium]|nr:BMP family ABC transporter substrate-binding protein [Burkholderiales bacterium]
MTESDALFLARRRALAQLSAASLAGLLPWARAQKPLTIGAIYVGAKDDFGYNQSHAEAVAQVRKMPGL